MESTSSLLPPRDETLFRHALLGETLFQVVRDLPGVYDFTVGVLGHSRNIRAAAVDPRGSHPQTPPPCETEFRPIIRDETEFRHEGRGGLVGAGLRSRHTYSLS